MEQFENQITLRGDLLGLPEFSHENHGRRFYRFILEVPRLSGTVDLLPVIAEEYGDVVWSLRQLGRNLEAIELCDRAIRELPMPAACDAYYIRGNYRLHSYDSAGVEDIYTAIENNSNYLDEGISTIGTFCCLTGNAEELERYRQRAVELAQNYEDTHRNIETLTPKDQLSAEKLPDGLLERF